MPVLPVPSKAEGGLPKGFYPSQALSIRPDVQFMGNRTEVSLLQTSLKRVMRWAGTAKCTS
jgi:hypothetical protein